MLGAFAYLVADSAVEYGEVSDCSPEDEVVGPFGGQFLGSAANHRDVLEPEAGDHVLDGYDFLGDGVDEGEIGRGVADGERYAGQTAPGADVEQTCLGHEAKEFCGDEAMGQVLNLYAFGVLPGDEIYLGVPFSEKLGVGGQAFPCFLGYFGKPPGEGGPWILFRVH